MNNDKLNMVSSVIAALNTVETKGRQNLSNLSGAIAILEDLWEMLRKEKESKAERDKPEA